MSSVYWNVTLVSIINNTTSQINRYFSLFIFTFGIIGNILNILVLAQRTFRSNPCALLFLVSSIANLIGILGGLTSRMLSGWGADLTNTIQWLCQFRVFIVWVSRTFAMWIIVLAAVDRWLLTSTTIHRRQMSQLKNAYRGMIIIFILSSVVYLELFYCYDANLINTPLKCYGKTDACRIFTDFTYAFVTNVIPIFFMLLFGTMTIFNVRKAKQCIQPQLRLITSKINLVNGQPKRSKRIDHYLLVILLIQVFILSILMLPSAFQKLYATLTLYHRKSPLQNAIENLIFNFVILLIYIASGSPFYIFTLYGGKTFRNAGWNLVKDIARKIRC